MIKILSKQECDALRAIAEEAAVLGHNEREAWYDCDELLKEDYSTICYLKNAKLIEAASPETILRRIATVDFLKQQINGLLSSPDSVLCAMPIADGWPKDS